MSQVQQKVLFVTPVALFEIVDGKTVERGNCACAIVALPTDRPKYSLVCYNDRRETLCVGSLTSSNEHSIQFEIQVSMYASFRDSTGRRWSLMFLKSAHVDSFLAVLGIAFYALSGHPPHATVISDFAPPTGDVRLGLQHRVKVLYTAFAIRNGDVLQLGETLETNGDRPYNFQPVQSAMALHPEAKGFESSVLGMMEDSRRTVVVPATLPRGGKHLYGGDSVAFVVQVVRILHDDTPMDAAARVPHVFASAQHNGSGSVGDGPASIVPYTSPGRDASGTHIVVLHTETRGGPPTANANAISGGVGVGAGVPAEQMAVLQRIGAQINDAATSARDIRDVSASVAGDWKHSVNRPKPSALTNAALEQAVKQLVMDNERIKDDMARRDELIRSIDQRNRDLQKRVDTAAIVSQQLLDEKSDSIRSASDVKLEKDRTLMRLQEQINHASHERDDLQRHLQIVKKLLEAADDEMRQMRGKADVHHIQSQSITVRLDAMQDALAEERSRRKGLEAKVLALQEEIRAADADLHVRTAQLNDVCRSADMDRAHMAQIMENERQRRAFESQQLRDEVVAELQSRDLQFRADRARVAEEHFARGHSEGRAIGRREGRAESAARDAELRLEAQRGAAELGAAKDTLRRSTADGLSRRSACDARVAELRAELFAATRARVVLDARLSAARAALSAADGAAMARASDAAARLRAPAAPVDLVRVMESLRCGAAPDFGFALRDAAAEREADWSRRVQWAAEEFFAIAQRKAEEAFGEFVEPVAAAHAEATEAVRALWACRDGAALFDFLAAERHDRYSVEHDADSAFAALAAFYAELMAQRVALLDEATACAAEILQSHEAAIAAVTAQCRAELEARSALAAEGFAVATAIRSEEAEAFGAIAAEAAAGVAAALCHVISCAEEDARAAIDADECAAHSGLRFDAAVDAARRAVDAARGEENRARDAIAAEECSARERMAAAANAFFERSVEEPTAATEAETTAAAIEAETTAAIEAETTAAAIEAETTAAIEAETTAAAIEAETTAAIEAETTAAIEAETTAAAIEAVTSVDAAAQAKAKAKVVVKVNDDASKGEADGSRPPPAQPAKKSMRWDSSSSEDDREVSKRYAKPPQPAKVAQPRRMPPPKSSLFISSDSD